MTTKDDIKSWKPVNTTSESGAMEFDTRRDSNWLNPIAMSSLKRAVGRKQKKVILNGRNFIIEYGHVTKLPVSGDRASVLVKPADERFMVPFGYIAIDTLKNFQFEDKK